MRNRPLALITGFYADETRPWSMQDCVNYLPEVAEQPGTRTLEKLKTAPGLRPFSRLWEPDDPVRGVWDVEGKLFAVSGDTLFQVTADGEYVERGTIPGAGMVRADHNQITGGNEALFVNGSAGFVWNTQASTFTQITDEGYPGAIDVLFADGYLMQIEPARRFAFHSDLADALSYNTLDRFTSEMSPDLLVGHAWLNNDYILFSESTTEFFENTGAAQQPWRSKRIGFQKGCAGRYTIARLDNTVAWLGSDGMFYKIDGYSPRRISTRPIEQAIAGLNWAAAVAFVWETKGHSVIYWRFPDGPTFGFDSSQPVGFQWHRRESFGLSNWRVNSTAYWQRQWIAGDFQNGSLWKIDDDYFLEGDVEYISEIVSPVMHDNQNRVLMPRLEVVMDTGQPITVADAFPDPPPPVEITDWVVAQGTLAALTMSCAFIHNDGERIVMGQDNNTIAWTDDLGVTNWTLNTTTHPSSIGPRGVVRFLGVWHVFGHWSGSPRWCTAENDDLTAFSPQTITWDPGRVGSCAFLIGNSMYVAEMAAPSGDTFKLRKTVDGVNFTQIDTGIPCLVNGGKEICSHARTQSGAHVFGTSDGQLIRSADMSTFEVVYDFANTGSNTSVAALGNVVLAGSTGSGSPMARSTDAGNTFAPLAEQGGKVLANDYHFIKAFVDHVYTSETAEDGSWTLRLDADMAGSGVYSAGQGYASESVAVYGTFGTYAYVGTAS